MKQKKIKDLVIGDIFTIGSGRKKYMFHGYSPYYHNYCYSPMDNFNKHYYTEHSTLTVNVIGVI